MGRWIAPIVGAVSLLVLFVGLVRAETDTGTTAGVSLAFWGVAGLVLAGAGVGVVEFNARRAPARPAPRVAAKPRTR